MIDLNIYDTIDCDAKGWRIVRSSGGGFFVFYQDGIYRGSVQVAVPLPEILELAKKGEKCRCKEVYEEAEADQIITEAAKEYEATVDRPMPPTPPDAVLIDSTLRECAAAIVEAIREHAVNTAPSITRVLPASSSTTGGIETCPTGGRPAGTGFRLVGKITEGLHGQGDVKELD
jgi:hypothetical protein